MRAGIIASSAFMAVGLIGLCTPGCASPYGDEESAAQGASALAAKTCASSIMRAHDNFEGRSIAASEGWAKGRVSDGLPIITTPSAKTTSVLTSSVAATTDAEAKS